MVGIVGYGIYIPSSRIKISEIASVWKKDPVDISRSLGITEKAIASGDEDTVTLATEAARNAIIMAGIKPVDIEAIMVGSESHPYAVNPTSTIVAEALGFSRNYLAVDLEFACKAATAGVQAIYGLVASGKIKSGLVIGADSAQAKPHDVLEYTAGAGSAAFLIGQKNTLVNIIDFTSYSSDTPDFWRREGVRYPSHGGRFTGGPAYFEHVMGAAKLLLTKTKTTPIDFDYVVFHSPNGKFPKAVSGKLGFKEEQLNPGFIVDKIGNPYCGSSLLSLAAVLEKARPGQKIFLVSYGSGAGADAFILETTKELLKSRQKIKNISWYLKNKSYISYTDMLKNEGKI
ncbi:hydroxymethylglutaryl-CoA synthase [Candidatus Gottesmanbacteria bacterium]|nr:hydroxymethylglutaryl-CoA synthase [Candidatus Gottesmanbacteria bacterium]